jgi:hypothetical protein
MDERILKWLYDIDFALNEIESYSVQILSQVCEK